MALYFSYYTQSVLHDLEYVLVVIDFSLISHAKYEI